MGMSWEGVVLKVAFWISGLLWLGGALITSNYDTNNRLHYLEQLQNTNVEMINLHDFFVHICGPLTVILGVVLFIQWAMKLGKTPPETSSTAPGFHWQRGMPIYRMNGVSDEEGEFCEAAIAANQFRGHGVDEDGDHVLSIQHSGRAYVVKVGVQKAPGLGDALILRATYSVTPDRITELAHDLGASRP